MNVEQRVMTALQPICAVVAPMIYTGRAKEYIVFIYDSAGAIYAEGTATEQRELLQIHYYLPHGKNPVNKKRAICRALAAAGATYPLVTYAGDDDGQHYVFECEMVTSYGPDAD